MLELEVQIRVIHGWIKRRSSSRLKPSRATTLYRLDHYFFVNETLSVLEFILLTATVVEIVREFHTDGRIRPVIINNFFFARARVKVNGHGVKRANVERTIVKERKEK